MNIVKIFYFEMAMKVTSVYLFVKFWILESMLLKFLNNACLFQ